MKRRFFRALYRLKTDPNHIKRKVIGYLFVIGGLLGPVLPVLGLWMLPIGIIILSVDLAWAKELRQYYRSWRNKRRRAKNNGN